MSGSAGAEPCMGWPSPGASRGREAGGSGGQGDGPAPRRMGSFTAGGCGWQGLPGPRGLRDRGAGSDPPDFAERCAAPHGRGWALGALRHLCCPGAWGQAVPAQTPSLRVPLPHVRGLSPSSRSHDSPRMGPDPSLLPAALSRCQPVRGGLIELCGLDWLCSTSSAGGAPPPPRPSISWAPSSPQRASVCVGDGQSPRQLSFPWPPPASGQNPGAGGGCVRPHV